MLKTGERRLGTHRRGWRAITVGAVLAVVASALIVVDVPTAVMADGGSSCGASINPIACENSKPGTSPSVWDIDGAGDPSIQGFATDISVNAGNTIDFKVDTDATSYKIDIYRTGWYQGLGARFIQSVPVTAPLPQRQPQCISDQTTELYDCGTWNVSASWNVPSTAVSGVYIALLHRNDTGGESHIIFIVRNDGNHSDVVFQTSDPTWQAYNTYGGSDFYQGGANGRAYKISYNRPFATRGWVEGRDFYFSSEYATVRFLERNGYDVSYMAGVDTDRFGSQLLNHKVFLSVGHDEYWSAAQRKNVAAARDAGVNLQFLSGNEVYWHTRYEASSADGSSTPYRTLVSYKETWSNAKIDPSPEWTGTWRDPRFATAANGGTMPENGLTGTMYMSNNTDLPVTVTSEEGKTRLWRNTSLTSLPAGTSQALAAHTVGYESDEDVDNGFRPAGLIRLSTTIGATPQYLTDYGNVVVPGTTEHHLTLYRARSGALVFGAGTIQWGWGLDAVHDGDGAPADPRMQQAQVNLLADMGAQPATLMGGLVAAAASTDTTAPSTTITSPASGATIAGGSKVTVTGTAADAGGVVAGVEVSTDGGSTWHPATGTTSWTYTYVQQGSGTVPVTARAIDDSANYSATGVSIPVKVAGPYSAFGDVTPVTPSADDTGAVELGLRFTPASDGYVSGVRFYKGAANTGTHVGSLWDANGTRLGTVTFATETATGWQKALFTSPIQVIAGQKYTVSYTAPQGGYAADALYWPYHARASSPVAVESGVGAAAPGVFGAPGTLPTSTWYETNYYVDVLFDQTDGSPLRIVSTSPVQGSSSNPVDAPVKTVFSRDILPSSLTVSLKDATGTAVAGTTAYDSASRTATFTPSAALAPSQTYTVAVAATDADGVGLAAGTGTWTFITAEAVAPDGTCPCSLFTDLTRPDIASASDTASVTVGVKFSSSEAGTITALRFYKGPGNGGTHVGTLWTAGGSALASVTFTGESTQGWQTATLSAPVAVAAGTTYVVSYTAPAGGYAVTAGRFANAYSRGPLQVPANGAVFTYRGGFPDQSSTTDYSVDVVFAQKAVGPSIVSLSPEDGATDVATGSTVSATFDAAVTAATLRVSNAGTAISGSTALSGDGKTVTFTPSAPFPEGVTLTVSITDVEGANGAAGGDWSWSFTTVGGSGQDVVTMFSGTPSGATTAVDDSASVILGMSFTTSVPGQVRALRFYKAASNTGAHTGWLWGGGSTPLAAVTFTSETSSGWQRATLSTPIDIAPGQTYTVSYLAPNGNYTYKAGAFASPVTSGPLTAISPANGTYLYGTSGRPTATFNSTNYFVDVEFVAAASGVAQTLFGDATPTTTAEPDAEPVEVGTAFTVSAPGEVTALRFYKGAGNTGTHVGTLWSADGAELTRVTFTDESDTGWQRASLSTPVGVTTGQTYVVSYFAPAGHYASQYGYFTSPVVNGFITGVATQNGRYLYSPTGGFPTQSIGATAYFVDAEIVFGDTGTTDPSPSPSPTPTTDPSPSPDPQPVATFDVTARTPNADATAVAPTTTVAATFDGDPGAAAVAVTSGAGAVAGATTYDAGSKTVTFTPTDPLAWKTTYAVTVTVAGATVTGGTWSFTTDDAPPVKTVETIFGDALPTYPSWNDPDSVQVATRFSVDVAGEATGVRFYKGSANSGQHTGYLWSVDGQKLAEVSFADETDEGWQTAAFTTPVTLEPGVEYRVGLYSTTGRYAVDLGTLAAKTTVGPFTIPAQGSAWIYSKDFPSNVSTNNYWVDVTFTPTQ